MLSNLKVNDDVEIVLRDKSAAPVTDHVERIERDGSVKFTKLGFRYRSGMEFHDHPSKKDIVSVVVTGASNATSESETGPQEITDMEELKRVNAQLTDECNAKTVTIERQGHALEECLAMLSRSIEGADYEAFELEIDAILNGSKDVVSVVADKNAKPAKKAPAKKAPAKKDEGKENADNTTGQASDSEETATAEGDK